MDRIPTLIALHPRRSIVIGKAVLLVGAVMVLCAVFARSSLAGLNEERARAGLSALRTLAEAFPAYPTWFVPETVLGFGIAAALVVAGTTLVTLGEKAAKR
ncbi:hypothetical protein [Ramlibacter albus]|uniref:Uncharacterized protein n=1 Tax=Ramlibacter albus TaxID=2079448 RepID=A0A923S4Z6_9BURK|nr:hypothetical protein [Ramlibacter albus]MBC5764647.1 hypothetical protein [Ramlibacter albus]